MRRRVAAREKAAGVGKAGEGVRTPSGGLGTVEGARAHARVSWAPGESEARGRRDGKARQAAVRRVAAGAQRRRGRACVAAELGGKSTGLARLAGWQARWPRGERRVACGVPWPWRVRHARRAARRALTGQKAPTPRTRGRGAARARRAQPAGRRRGDGRRLRAARPWRRHAPRSGALAEWLSFRFPRAPLRSHRAQQQPSARSASRLLRVLALRRRKVSKRPPCRKLRHRRVWRRVQREGEARSHVERALCGGAPRGASRQQQQPAKAMRTERRSWHRCASPKQPAALRCDAMMRAPVSTVRRRRGESATPARHVGKMPRGTGRSSQSPPPQLRARRGRRRGERAGMPRSPRPTGAPH
jgi:hypothetical protein